MTLLNLLFSKGLDYHKTGSRYVGQCPACGGGPNTNKFVIKIGSDTGHCFACNWNGDSIKYLRDFEGLSCGAAHAQLGKKCESTTCPKLATCKQGTGEAPKRSLAGTPVPPAPRNDTFTPGIAQTPQEIWQEHAEKLVAYAHEQLLNTPEQLSYLAGRGLDLEAVKKYRLGWLNRDEYRARQAWGLPEELKEDKKPKRLWLPKGIVIPFFVAGVIHRVRIRKAELRNEDDSRYYWVPGSGNDVVVINPAARAFVVVESDLDGLLIDHLAGDLVGAVPLGTCSAKPKELAFQILTRCLAILVALDFDPGTDKAGNYKNPGGKSARWWLEQFPQARRWPVIGAKDPGDAFKNGVDLRAWIIAGLPPAMTITVPAAVTPVAEPVKTPDVVESPAASTTISGEVHTVRVTDGRLIHVTDDQATYAALVAEGKIVFNGRELAVVRATGATKEQAVCFLNVKEAFPGASIEKVIASMPGGN